MEKTALIIIGCLGTIGCVALLSAIHFLIRNEFVYKFRKKIRLQDDDLFNKLPSYDTMLYSFRGFKSFLPCPHLNRTKN